MSRDLVVVPSALALLPGYAGAVDPVRELRAACAEAVAWLVDRHPDRVVVVTAGPRPEDLARGVEVPAGVRIARHLLAAAAFAGEVEAETVPEAMLSGGGAAAPRPPAAVLVVADGSAKRSEKAPGHLDERSFAFDEQIDRALRSGDAAALADLDAELGEELWCRGVPAFQAVSRTATGPVEAQVCYADDPFGVQYWVVRWTCGS